MVNRLLLAGAGGGGSNNLVRAIRRIGGAHVLVGTNSDPYALSRSLADQNYLIAHSSDEERYLETLERVINEHGIELVIPTNDTELGVISRHRDRLSASMWLPEPAAVEICQDKARFATVMHEHGVPSPRGRVVEDLDALDDLFDWFGHPPMLWIRLRRGTGSRGTLPVATAEQARFWIKYWVEARQVAVDDFVLNDYLPGREFAWQSLWCDGDLVIAKTCERVEYLFGANTPSGTMSTPRVARLVREPAVDAVARRAVLAVSAKATGVFSLDIKEDRDGQPHVTEINAGRFFRISPIFNFSGSYNMAQLLLALAAGRRPEVPEQSQLADFEEETFWICDIEDVPSVLTRTELEARFRRLA